MAARSLGRSFTLSVSFGLGPLAAVPGPANEQGGGHDPDACGQRSASAPAQSREVLQEEVKEVMRAVLGAAEVHLDGDGDIPVRCGSATVYVRVLEDRPVVRIWSPVISAIGSPEGILAEVNEFNRGALFAKALWDGESVVVTAEVAGSPLAAGQLRRAYAAVAQLADGYARKLQARYGGRAAVGPSFPHTGPRAVPGYL